MFYGMTTWIFWRRGGKLSRLVAGLMLLICLGCIKDTFALMHSTPGDEFIWSLITVLDLIVVPMYTFVLRELVRPDSTNRRELIVHETPFVVLPALYIVTESPIVYYANVILAVTYGTYFLIWTQIQIPKYHARLKEQFSYTENINLNWLRLILYTFYFILALWGIDSIMFKLDLEQTYLILSLIFWIVIDFYIYKHDSVISGLACHISEESTPDDNYEILTPKELPTAAYNDPQLCSRIDDLFKNEKIFLNPNLKLSDIAKAADTNRTYTSNYFNNTLGTTFYDYVNGLRIDYACQLLKTLPDPIKVIAEMSGYNSPQAFIRVFKSIKRMSPTEYRTIKNSTIRKG